MVLPSCENMRDDNGDLGGMWQMTEWRVNATDEIKEVDPEDLLYYGIHRDLMKIYKADGNKGQYIVPFKQAPGKLILSGVYSITPTDSLIQFSDPRLSSFAIPEDGTFDILQLNEKKLVLHTQDYTLSFRKY